MSLYLVRVIGSKEAVGIVYAESAYDLADCVDECTDPGGCEYKRLPSKSAVFFEHGCDSIPSSAPEGEGQWGIGEISVKLAMIMACDDNRPWKPLSNDILMDEIMKSAGRNV